MTNSSPRPLSTYEAFLQQGHRLAASHSQPHSPIHNFEIPVRAIQGGRSPSSTSQDKFDGLPLQRLSQVQFALDALRELALECGEQVLEDPEIVRWMEEIELIHANGESADRTPADHPDRNSIDLTQPNDDNQTDLTTPPTKEKSKKRSIYKQGDIPYMDDWIEDLFQRDLECKRHNEIFTGGANDLDEYNDTEICPFCRRSVGEADDQHVVKCKYAHEEQELLLKSLERRKK